MEEKRLYCRRLHAYESMKRIIQFLLISFVFSSSLYAENTKTVEVEVNVDIKNGNDASAVQDAQQKAFEQAVQNTLPDNMDAVEKAKRIKDAADFIKSFQMISQREEAGKLYAQFSCEVILPSEKLPSSADQRANFASHFAIEFVWKKSTQPISITQLRSDLVSKYKLKVGLVKMQRGSAWVELTADTAAPSIFSKLESDYAAQADLKLITDIEALYGELPASAPPGSQPSQSQ